MNYDRAPLYDIFVIMGTDHYARVIEGRWGDPE